MPTPASTDWPRPKSSDEWEEMVLDAMRIRWKDKHAYRYGRNGQRQSGIDIIGHCGANNVAAQAKKCKTLTKTQIEKDVKKATNLFLPLDELFFVISGDRDTRLQELIKEISDTNSNNNKFNIYILFFEDVCSLLSENHDLINKYWQSFYKSVSQILNKHILSSDDAYNKIIDLTVFKNIQQYIFEASHGEVSLCLRIENVPKLEEPPNSIERCWQVAISENHKTHIVTLWRFAINIDTSEITFYLIEENKWVPQDHWEEYGLFNNYEERKE